MYRFSTYLFRGYKEANTVFHHCQPLTLTTTQTEERGGSNDLAFQVRQLLDTVVVLSNNHLATKGSKRSSWWCVREAGYSK
jgi:hypothetical protein